VKARKDPTRTWHPFTYLATEDDSLTIAQHWLEEWMSPPSEDVGIEKGTPQDAGMSGKDTENEQGMEETEPEQEHGTYEPLNDERVSEESPFIIKKMVPTTTMSCLRKKQKVDKSRGVTPVLLTNGEIDEIGEKVEEVTTETWDIIDDHYRMILVEIY